MIRLDDEITKLKIQPPFDIKIDDGRLRYYAEMYLNIAHDLRSERRITVGEALKAIELSIMHFSRDIDDENIAGLNSSLLKIHDSIDNLSDEINRCFNKEE